MKTLRHGPLGSAIRLRVPANALSPAIDRHPWQRRRARVRTPRRRAGAAVAAATAAILVVVGGSRAVRAQSIPGESRVLDIGRLEENGASEQATAFRAALEQRLTDLKSAREQVAEAKARYEQKPCDETEAELIDATARAFVLEFRADERIVEVGTPLIDELATASAALVEAQDEVDDAIRAYETAGEEHLERGDELDKEIQQIALSVADLLDRDDPLPSDVRSAVALAAAEAGRERRLSEANRTVADNTRLTGHQYESYVAVLETYSGQVDDAVNGARSRLVEISEMGRLMQAECMRARRGRAAGRFVENLGALGELIAAIASEGAHWAIPRATGAEPIDIGPSDEHVKQTLRQYLEKHRRASMDPGEVATNRE